MAARDLVLAIDPSTTIAGIAIGRGKPLIRANLLYSSAVIMDKEDLEWRVRGLLGILTGLHTSWGFNHVVIEMPEVRHDPTGTKASTSGAMAKLNFAVGAIWQWARATVGGPVVLVPVHEWKGQLPKELMLRRLQKRGLCLDLQPTARSLNESDAVALLSWYVEKHG